MMILNNTRVFLYIWNVTAGLHNFYDIQGSLFSWG